MIAVQSHNERKHESRNLFLRYVIRRFHDTVTRLVQSASPRSLIEVGCGEGYVLKAIIDSGIDSKLHGFDISPEAVWQAQQRVGGAAEVERCELGALTNRGIKADVVLAIEVLEHLADPREMLAGIAQLTSKYAILSVPHEPWFQTANFLRGKYVRRWGNHPEHLQRWTRHQFHEFVKGPFRILDSPPVFPWTLVLAELR